MQILKIIAFIYFLLLLLLNWFFVIKTITKLKENPSTTLLQMKKREKQKKN